MFGVRLGPCCAEVYYGTVGEAIFFDKLLQSCARNWIKISPPKQSHGAIHP